MQGTDLAAATSFPVLGLPDEEHRRVVYIGVVYIGAGVPRSMVSVFVVVVVIFWACLFILPSATWRHTSLSLYTCICCSQILPTLLYRSSSSSVLKE